MEKEKEQVRHVCFVCKEGTFRNDPSTKDLHSYTFDHEYSKSDAENIVRGLGRGVYVISPENDKSKFMIRVYSCNHHSKGIYDIIEVLKLSEILSIYDMEIIRAKYRSDSSPSSGYVPGADGIVGSRLRGISTELEGIKKRMDSIIRNNEHRQYRLIREIEDAIGLLSCCMRSLDITAKKFDDEESSRG